MTTKITGIPQALRILRDVDPQLRKQAVDEIKSATEPLVNAARQRVPQDPSPGWSTKGRTGFSAGRVRNSIRPQFRASQRRGAERFTLVRVRMMNAGGQIFATAGTASAGRTESGRALVGYLNRHHGRGQRIMWPAAEQELPSVTRAVQQAAARVEDRASRLARR